MVALLMSGAVNRSDIDKITDLMRDFIVDSSERATRSEALIENLAKSIDQVAVSSKEAIDSNSRLERKIISLEETTINKVVLLEDTVNEATSRIEVIGGRVGVLELINANNAGKLAGKAEANELNDKKATNYWGRTLGLITIAVAVTAIITQLITSGNTPS